MDIEAVLDHLAVKHPEVALQLATAIQDAVQAEVTELISPNPELVTAQADLTTTQSLVAKYTPAPVVTPPLTPPVDPTIPLA